MVLKDACELRLIGDGLDVVRQLLVPKERVATDTLAALLGEIDEGISTPEAEAATDWFNRIPLHTILGRQLPEVLLDNSSILGLGQGTRVGCRAVVKLSLCLEQCVDAVR